jgi:serine/threonine-protein kinase RsbW
MATQRLEDCPHGAEARLPILCQVELASPAAVANAIGMVTDALAKAKFAEKDVTFVQVALHEALANAIEHGHLGNWSEPVSLCCALSGDKLVCQVTDRGPGFNPDDVPDPTAPENLERDSGRGLLLMRAFMSKVCHSERGNCVCFCKNRLESTAQE